MPRRPPRRADRVRSAPSWPGGSWPDGPARPCIAIAWMSPSSTRLKVYLSGARQLGRLERVEDLDAAAFVLFGAEWFRRSFSGGVAKWSDLAAAIGGPVPYPTLTALTREGLRWWGRPVRRHHGANEWFLTLRLEGGFPSRLLETQERGWLLSHLRGLVSGLSNGPLRRGGGGRARRGRRRGAAQLPHEGLRGRVRRTRPRDCPAARRARPRRRGGRRAPPLGLPGRAASRGGGRSWASRARAPPSWSTIS